MLDADNSGKLSLAELRRGYSACKHPEVAARRVSEEDETQRFLATFQAGGREGDIALQDWIAYYADVSSTMEDDNYFCTVLWNSWNTTRSAPGKSPAASPAAPAAAPGKSLSSWM